MKASTFFIGLLLSLLVLGCERAADINAQKHYDNAGIHFSYPGNWQVSDDVQGEHHRYIIVESPGSAIFVAHIYPIDEAVSLDDFAHWFSKAASKEIPMIDFVESKFSSVGKPASNADLVGKKEDFVVTLLGEKIPHTREYYAREQNGKMVYLISQAANQDSDKVSPGFDLLLGSFTLE